MQPGDVIMLGLFGGGLLSVALAGTFYPPLEQVASLHRLRKQAAPTFALLLLLLGYLIWERQSRIDEICQGLRGAITWSADGPAYDRFSLTFPQTVNLMERLPTLREATRNCDSASNAR